MWAPVVVAILQKAHDKLESIWKIQLLDSLTVLKLALAGY